MPKVRCSDCDRKVGMHELETKTVAQTTGFNTRYRCPFCRTDIENVSENII